MSEAEEKFNEEFALVAGSIFEDTIVSLEDAEESVRDLLRAHAALLAERILANTQHIRYGCATDYAERYSKLITKEGEES
jgi:hypothetical protein